jgi:ribonuclease HI
MKSRENEETALILYSDGASRGNPGPSAWAYILLDKNRNIMEERAGSIGRGTNNEAEYHGLIEGLRAAVRHGGTWLSVFSDSELVIRQMNGKYRVASPRLMPLHHEAKSLSGMFMKIEYHSVPRDHPYIAKADLLCNTVLDRESRD